MLPNRAVALQWQFLLPPPIEGTKAQIQVFGLPLGSRFTNEDGDSTALVAANIYVKRLRFIAPPALPHGSIALARLTIRDGLTGQIVEESERLAAFDTIPPTVGSYRAVLLRDGRIAIQVQVGDRHSGVAENAVSTRFSIDGGKTWRQQVHFAIHDDFERPAIFETVIGPIPTGSEVLLGLNAEDMVGNSTLGVPADATVILAPLNAERLLNLPSGVEGNPIFSAESIARLAQWVDTAYLSLLNKRSNVPREVERAREFELRRLHDLRALPEAFRARHIDLVGFKRSRSSRLTSSLNSTGVPTFLRVQEWR
jgi:hypothetical protein